MTARGGIVVDIGNTRLKWGQVDDAGRIVQSAALSTDRPDDWSDLWESWRQDVGVNPALSVSSVSPPIAALFRSFLGERGIAEDSPNVVWYRSAADVPVSHRLENAETAGADRALAVLAAMRLLPDGRPGLIVSCGTAITIERITRERVWQGGAIAPGLRLSAQSLNRNTAQLPLIEPGRIPASWGNSTRPAIEAGVFWGVAGAVRELLKRQEEDLPGHPWVVWTGGDAESIARSIDPTGPRIMPHLVLDGLILVSRAKWSDSGRGQP